MSGGERIRMARRRRGITQKALADLVGCSQQTIVDIEKQEVPRSKFLPAIVVALDENLEWIQTGSGAPSNGNAGALPHYDLESAALRMMDASHVDSVIDYLACSPIPCGNNSFTVHIDELSAELLGNKGAEDCMGYVDPSLDPRPSDIVLVVLPGCDRAEFRIYKSIGGKRYLTHHAKVGDSSIECELFSNYADYQNAVLPEGVTPALLCGKVYAIGWLF